MLDLANRTTWEAGVASKNGCESLFGEKVLLFTLESLNAILGQASLAATARYAYLLVRRIATGPSA